MYKIMLLCTWQCECWDYPSLGGGAIKITTTIILLTEVAAFFSLCQFGIGGGKNFFTR
jgi:hypothetical protein